MQNVTLWRALTGVDKNTVIEDYDYNQAEEILHVSVRPRRTKKARCGRCGLVAPWYDRGHGTRTWRALDLGTIKVDLEAETPRVNCAVHGPTVRQVPWAAHGAGFTHAFDQQVAWLATQCSKSAVTQLMRIAWRTVGTICERVWAKTAAGIDPLAGLGRIGIDEISYKRNHRYLTVVVDHDTKRLVWAAPGRDRATVNAFFDALAASSPAQAPPEQNRCAQITHVSADGAAWIGEVVSKRCPAAIRCADPFHVVAWAIDALDAVRRDAWRAAQRAGHTASRGWSDGKPQRRSTGLAQQLQRTRYPLWKNPENLTVKEQAKLAWIAKTDPRLHRAYLLKEGLRTVFQMPAEEAPEALERWLSWARRCRIENFVKLSKRIVKHRDQILAAIEHDLSNALTESMNTKIRLITRRAFGFKNPQALIALSMLSLGGHPPTLPGRK